MADKSKLKATIAENRRAKYAEGTPETPVGVSDAAPETAPEAAPAPEQEPQYAPAPAVDVINPNGELVNIDQSQLQQALNLGYRQATPQDLQNYDNEQKYGGTSEAVKAFGEGALSGIVTPPGAVAIERAFGANPENIRAREEYHGVAHGLGTTAGLVGSAIAGVGEGAALEEAGQAVRAALPAGKATFIDQIGPEAVKGAFEGALLQGGEELGRQFKEDPNASAGSAMMDIGLAGVMGGVFGGAAGAALQKAKYAGMELPTVAAPEFVSELDRPALEAGELGASVKYSDNLSDKVKSGVLDNLTNLQEKEEAPAIKAAAERLGAPVYEGMISDNEYVQRAEDSLINGAPTYSGIKRNALYKDAYNQGAAAVEDALGNPGQYTKAQLGASMRESLATRIQEENAPIASMYNELQKLGPVEVAQSAAQGVVKDLEEIPVFRITPSSPQGALVKRIVSGLDNVKTVEDLKVLRDSVWDSFSHATSPGEKRVAAILTDKLNELEESQIMAAAKKSASPEMFSNFVQQKEAASAAYKPFITKTKELLERLGKGKVHGAKDAINFIQNLTPEEIVNKLGTAKDSEFRNFFAKNFPEENALMRQYQRGELRDAATAGEVLSHKKLFNKINNLEPEIQQHLFSKEELQKLQDAELYLRSFPKNFNPSGTAHASAFRGFFEHPMGAAVANARDLGLEAFIKGVKRSPEANQAIQLANSAVKGDRLANRSIKAIFNKTYDIPAGAIPAIATRAKLDKMVSTYAQNPDKMLNSGDNNPVPEYAQAFGATSARAVSYLSSIKPQTSVQSPLDTKHAPSNMQQAEYNRALDICQQPLTVCAKIKQNTLTPKDIQTLQAVHPDVYRALQQKIMTNVLDQVNKGQSIPYNTRLQLSLFLGQPLDSTMTPQGIIAAQAKTPQGPQPSAAPGNRKGALSKLGASAKQAMTKDQSREAARAGHED